jgi:diguanylate cyclase (GGDEF)-like protein
MIAALLLAAGCSAPQAFSVPGEFLDVLPGTEARVFYGPAPTLSDITRPPGCQEFKLLTGTPNFGGRPGNVWLRFRPVFPDDASASWRLVVRFAGLEKVCVYWPVPGGTADQCLDRVSHLDHWRSGRLVFAPPADLDSARPVHLYAESRMWLKVPVELATVDYLLRTESRNELAWGMYYGLLVMIIVVSLALYAGQRDRASLYFALKIVMLTLWLALWQGRFLAWDTAGFSFIHVTPVLAGLFLVFGSRFYQHFLQTRLHARATHALLEACFWAGLVFGPLVTLVPEARPWLAPVFLGWLGAVLWAAAVRLRHRYWPAFWVLLAVSVLIVALFLNSLAAFGVLLLEARLTLHLLYAGNLAAAAFLVAGLVSQVRLLAAERDRATEVASANRNLALYRAHFDELTGLRNRAKFREDLQERIATPAAGPRRLAVITASPERFREMNQALGHDGGDAVLVELAERLRGALRAGELLARIGPATFALALELDPDDGVPGLEARCAALRKALAAPLMSGRGASLSVTLGGALYPDHGAAAEQLLRCSEMGHDHARDGGALRLFEPGLYRQAEHYLEMNQDLRAAISRDQLELHFQPLCRLEDGQLLAAEALLRWTRKGQPVPPDQFIPVAESGELIEPLTDWVFREAARQSRDWRARGLHIPLCVNVSAPQFRLPNFIGRIERALKEFDVPPELLMLEITESLLMDDLSATRATLAQLRERGIQVAVDDFGVGYSSLAYLRTLPVASIKIDRSFLVGVPHEAESVAVINAIIALGKDLLLHVIAEGVETQAQLDFLLAHGVSVGQGFLLAKPMPAGSLEQWLLARGSSGAEAAA